MSNKVSFGKKGCIFLPKISAYRRDFGAKLNIWFFLIKGHELLKKYNEIYEKVKNSIKKQFDSEPACNEKYLKVRIKSYNGKINTHFHNSKITKEGSHLICLLVTLIYFVLRTGTKYYPQVFL